LETGSLTGFWTRTFSFTSKLGLMLGVEQNPYQPVPLWWVYSGHSCNSNTVLRIGICSLKPVLKSSKCIQAIL
jgi:hypothetical protein